jgi:hypothetical protein
VLSSFACQRLATVVKDGSIPSLRGEANYRRNLKFVLGLAVLGICLLAGAAVAALVS